MNRKWICALAAFAATTLILFPLFLLWEEQPPLKSLILAAIIGVVSFFSAITVKREPEAQTPSKVDVPRWIPVAGCVAGVVLLGALFAHTFVTEGASEVVVSLSGIVFPILANAVTRIALRNE